MFHKSIWLVAGLLAAAALAPAQSTNSRIIQRAVTFTGNFAKASGDLTVFNNERGPDTVTLRLRDLPPNARFTIFLAESPAGGQLPVQLLGEVTTTGSGTAFLTVITEVVNAFATSNNILEGANGSTVVNGVPTSGAGSRANGAVALPLNFLRVYQFVENGTTVFGPSDAIPGGGFIGGTTEALP